MYYYKQIDENGELIMLLTYAFCPNIIDPLVIEITEEEYNALSAEIDAANQPEVDPDEISDAEFVNMLEAVL